MSKHESRTRSCTAHHRRRGIRAWRQRGARGTHAHEERQPEYRLSRRADMTGAHLCLLPQWRRKPPYRTLPSGLAEICIADAPQEDSSRWKCCFALDARLGFVRSHIHRCQETCWKHSGGGAPGDVIRVCRFGFNHEYATLLYRPRDPNPMRNVCRSKKCRFFKSKSLDTFWTVKGLIATKSHLPPSCRRYR